MFDYLSKRAVCSVVLCVAFLLFLNGCAGSPIGINRNTHEENVDFLREKPNKEICRGLENGKISVEKNKFNDGRSAMNIRKAFLKISSAAGEVFIERGYSPDYCDDPDQYEKVFIADNASCFSNISNNISKSEEGSSLDIQRKEDNEINDLLKKKNNSEICFAINKSTEV